MEKVLRAILIGSICFTYSCFSDSKFQCYETKEFDIASLKDTVYSVDSEFILSMKKAPDTRALPDNRKSQYLAIYRKCFQNSPSIDAVNNLSDKDLHILYDSLERISYYTHSNVVLNKLSEVIFERKKRGEDVNDLILDLHGGYIKSREFKKALDLEVQYPKLTFQEVPQIDMSKMGKTNLLAISGKNKSLVVEPFSFPSGGHVIIVASPQCSPSNGFFTWLLDSPNFLQALDSHLTIINPVYDGLNIKRLSDFNQAHPVQMKVVYKETEWPEIRDWSTPSFYFFNNGELVTWFSSWPNAERLKQGMNSIGLDID